MMGRGRPRQLRIGVALGTDLFVLVTSGSDRPHTESLPFSLGRGDPGPDLEAAFATAAKRVRDWHGEVATETPLDVALLPPLAEARLVDLPPLGAAEAEAVLRRDAARHFLGGTQPRVIGVVVPGARDARTQRRTTGGQEGGGEEGKVPPPVRVFAAAAPGGLVEAIHAAGRSSGVRVGRVVPALAAWAAAAVSGTSQAASASDSATAAALAIAVLGSYVHIVRLSGGHPTLLRRVPAGDPAEVAAAAGAGPGRAVIFGEAAGASPLAAALRSAGWTPVHEAAAGTGRQVGVETGRPLGMSVAAERPADSAGSVSSSVDDPIDGAAAEPRDVPAAAAAAAHYAGGARLALLPLSVLAARRDRQRRLAARVAAAAVLLLVAAGGVELWGAHRELDAIRTRRAEIRNEVVPLLELRDSISRLEARRAVIEDRAAGAPRLTRALTDLALLLPFDTYVTRLVASGDTLDIEAAGTRAGEALQALRLAQSLREVRLLGVVDRELDDGATAVERFRLRARLATDPQPGVLDGAIRSSPDGAP